MMPGDIDGEWHKVMFSDERRNALYKVGFFWLAGLVFGLLVGGLLF